MIGDSRRLLFAFLAVLSSQMLCGCVAVVIPVVAAGAIGKTQVLDEQIGPDFKALEDFLKVPSGNGEVGGQTTVHTAGDMSVILAQLSDIQRPSFTPCDGKPKAILVDLDKNVGAESNPKSAAKRHERLAKLASLAGRELLYFSARDERARVQLEKSLSNATGRQIRAETNLFLDNGAQLRRDLRRWDIAKEYCVTAIVGDTKDDFTDSYAFLRQPGAPSAAGLDLLIERGWFLIPGLDPL